MLYPIQNLPGLRLFVHCICVRERFSKETQCRKTITKVITSTNHGRCRQRNEPIQIRTSPCNLLKAREKSRVQVAIAFGFPSHWLINWRETLKPITERSNYNRVIIFDTQLKTALM